MLGFKETDVRVNRDSQYAEVTVIRSEGADGKISCYIRTEALSEVQTPQNAIEFDDYVPKFEKVEF